MTKTYAGPAWDNTAEYPSLQSKELKGDIDRAVQLIGQLEQVSAKLAPLVARATQLSAPEADAAVKAAQDAFKIYEDAMVLLWNVDTFLSCELSTDGKNAEAKTMSAKTRSISAKLASAYNPVEQFLKLTSDDVVTKFLADPRTKAEKFALAQERKLKDHALPLGEEDLIIGLTVDGPTAFGTLYDNLSGTISCTLKLPEGERQVGLAEAASLSQDEREDVRKAAFRAVGSAWEQHEEAVSSILNSLAGWRQELYRRRSHKKPMHFLDEPLHRGRIARATLDAMMEAVREARPAGQRALELQAKVLGKDKMGPWDLFAPCPRVGGGASEKYTYDEAIALIASAFDGINPEMGNFVRMMAEKKWIEATVGPTKRPGAYCTKFPKSRTPRVYMTYTGGMRELKTLAHELGHAFHNWVMKDMPLSETFYPMTLAETASIFGETVVNGALLAKAKSPADKLSFTWAAAREVESLCLNIPARFQFEKAFYEKRQESTLNPPDFKALMTESWRSWYGDALSEMDPMFWASKLHFSIAGLSFYNFPYTFGFLFALGVYAQKDKLGSKFYDAYVSLLRDTGRMTAEEVASKHLGADLTKPDFWRQSLKVATRHVDEFEEAVKAAGR